MSRHVSPFAALTGAEKQIKWLEYQTLRLPYVKTNIDQLETENKRDKLSEPKEIVSIESAAPSVMMERPQPPPEIPRMITESKSRHSQYDAVIARLKQAELQSRRSQPLA